MPHISDDLRILLWVLAAISGSLSAIIGNVLAINIVYFFTRRGRRPTKRPTHIWMLFYLGAIISVGSGALAAFAPATPNEIKNPEITPQNPTSIAQVSPTLQLEMWNIDYFSNIYLNLPSAYHVDQPATANDEGGYTVEFKSFDLRSDPQIPQSNFSIRMSGLFHFEDGYYEFHCQHHDGCRVYVDGQVWVDAWWDGEGGHDRANDISAGNHIVSIEFYDKSGLGLLEVIWKLKVSNTPSVSTSESTIQISPKDGMEMVFIPAGEFMMGSNNEEAEKPIHKVNLDAFWIDKTEVTNGMYEKCVQAGKCKMPASIGSPKHTYYYGNPEFFDYPIISILWNDAFAYCAWANRRLPTEAEWEKAARGEDGRVFPWGSFSPSNSLLNYNNVIGTTTEVGKYPDGISFYGALDMAGNVWEWVADWYDPGYYSNSPVSNPLGPNLGEYHVLRGGSWLSPLYHTSTTVRRTKQPGFRDDIIGFRCADSE